MGSLRFTKTGAGKSSGVRAYRENEMGDSRHPHPTPLRTPHSGLPTQDIIQDIPPHHPRSMLFHVRKIAGVYVPGGI